MKPNYRYFIVIDTTPDKDTRNFVLNHEVFPVNGQDVKYIENYEDGQIFKRKKLSDELIFVDDKSNNISDFSFLIKELGKHLCNEYRILVRQLCNGSYKDYWEGYFTMAWGKWDEDECKVLMPLEPNDRYRCMLELGSNAINVLDITNINSLIIANNIKLEYITCPQIIVSGLAYITAVCPHVDVTFGTGLGPPLVTANACVSGSPTWMLFYQKVYIDPVFPATLQYIDTTWVREYEITLDVGGQPNSPAGLGWVQDIATTLAGKPATKWVRPPYNGAFQTYTWSFVNPGCYVSMSWEQPSLNTDHTRCRTLNDIIELLGSQCNDSIRSDFFDLNSPEDNSLNYVTGEINKARYTLVEQATDAIYPTASQGATIGLMSWSDLTQVLKYMFNCYWDYIDGVLRIEHFSFFTNNQGIDLTKPEYAKQIKYSNKYTYELKELPKIERWIMKEMGGIDFVGVDVVYNNICVNQDSKTNLVQYDISLVSTDIDYIQRNPDEINKDGFVFYSCYFASGIFTLNQDTGLLTATPQLNGHFSLANLEGSYHLHGRILPVGVMNNIITDFLSWRRTKKQKVLNIVICCDENFNSQELMKTNLGWGEILTSEFSTKTNTLAVLIKHYANG